MSRYGRDTVELDIKLYSSNQAFIDDPAGAAARAVKEVALDIALAPHGVDGDIRDVNGNKVGTYEFRVTEDSEGEWT